MGKSQIIFSKGKETAMKYLFGTDGFGYLAIGYDSNNEGFEDITDTQQTGGFVEISGDESYQRIPLEYMPEGTTFEQDTEKVLVKFKATLDYENIQNGQNINQIAIVNNSATDSAQVDTDFYAATTFPTFVKNSLTSITFVIGFRF